MHEHPTPYFTAIARGVLQLSRRRRTTDARALANRRGAKEAGGRNSAGARLLRSREVNAMLEVGVGVVFGREGESR